jgi:hypothetical protein
MTVEGQGHILSILGPTVPDLALAVRHMTGLLQWTGSHDATQFPVAQFSCIATPYLHPTVWHPALEMPDRMTSGYRSRLLLAVRDVCAL